VSITSGSINMHGMMLMWDPQHALPGSADAKSCKSAASAANVSLDLTLDWASPLHCKWEWCWIDIRSSFPIQWKFSKIHGPVIVIFFRWWWRNVSFGRDLILQGVTSGGTERLEITPSKIDCSANGKIRKRNYLFIQTVFEILWFEK